MWYRRGTYTSLFCFLQWTVFIYLWRPHRSRLQISLVSIFKRCIFVIIWRLDNKIMEIWKVHTVYLFQFRNCKLKLILMHKIWILSIFRNPFTIFHGLKQVQQYSVVLMRVQLSYGIYKRTRNFEVIIILDYIRIILY